MSLLSAATAAAAPPIDLATAAPGTVVETQALEQRLWLPGTTSEAVKLTYVTTKADGKRALSSSAVFVPHGNAPRGGWPIVSWAHGTSGLGDGCAPSVVGPAAPDRDRPYLANWMKQGYAVVASDYVGLGTPGLMAYLHGRSTAHNVVDNVKAAREYANRNLAPTRRFARKWVAIGQSQGGGAAIYTARHATEFGGPGLDYRGAVGTGTPANVETLVSQVGPKQPPVALTPGITAYLSYIFTSLRDVHPELGIDGILTAIGRKYLKLAETECIKEFGKQLEGVNVGDYFTQNVSTLPRWREAVTAYMAMPTDGFDKPFFMGHGLQDADVPYASTAPYVAELQANGEPVTFKTYNNNHGGTVTESQPDTIPYVRSLFADDTATDPVIPARIARLRPRGAVRGKRRESVTLKNVTTTTINLKGYRLEDSSGNTIVLKAARIKPGARLRVFTGCRKGRTKAHRKGSRYYACKRKAIWNDKGDIAKLFAPAGDLLSQRGYKRFAATPMF